MSAAHSVGCWGMVRTPVKLHRRLLEGHSKETAGRAAALPIRGAAACRCSSGGTSQRFEFAGPVYSQTAPEFPAFQWYSPVRAPPRTKPSRKKGLPEVRARAWGSKVASSQRNNCIGEDSEEKAVFMRLRFARKSLNACGRARA